MADRIKELRALLAEATPGEWEIRGPASENDCNLHIHAASGLWVANARPWSFTKNAAKEQKANAGIIAAAKTSLPLLLDVAEAARWARDHISATPHGDNCHLTDEGDGAGCRCGKESMLDHLDTALAALEAHNGSD